MSDVQIWLPDYLRPPTDLLWQWEDNGDAVVWVEGEHAGQTAAMAAQLHVILRSAIEPLGGLPPMSCLLELIAACDDRFVTKDAIGRFARLWQVARRDLYKTNATAPPMVQFSLWVDSVRKLPKELRSGVEAQSDLLMMMFSKVMPDLIESSGIEAADVLECLSTKSTDRELLWAHAATTKASLARVKRAFHAMAFMSRYVVTVESVQLWKRTRVSELPQPTHVELETPPPKNPINHTIRALHDDEEYRAIARAAVSISSTLSLPRRPSDPTHLPCGGVSDVTNRGEPERLLMTELAQEPLAMLARIANGQALYLRRETPPGPSPEFRPVFLEAGIRTWGRIRLSIASVGLAIAALEERRGDTKSRVMTVAGDRIFEESFSTRDGVIVHLGRIEPDEHPGTAIARWLENIQEQSDTSFADPIIVISAATDRDADFRKSLFKMPSGTLIARIERDHRVTLLRRSSLGDETLQSISLPNDDMAVRSPESPNRKGDGVVPLFYSVFPCPLRFSDQLNGEWSRAYESSGVWTVTRDRRLLLFDRPGLGGIQVSDALPIGKVLASDFRDKKLHLVIGAADRDHFLLTVNHQDGVVTKVKLQSPSQPNMTYVFDCGSLFRFGKQVDLIHASTGQVAESKPLGNWTHRGGPVLWSPGHDLQLVSQVGTSLVFHDLKAPIRNPQFVSLVFRHPSGELIFFLSELRHFVRFNPSGEPVISQLKYLNHHLLANTYAPFIRYVSSDGDRIVVCDPNSARYNQAALVDLSTLVVKELKGTNDRLLMEVADRKHFLNIAQRNVLVRLDGLSFDREGHLMLIKQKRSWTLTPKRLSRDGEHQLSLQVNNAGESFGFVHRFGKSPAVLTRFGDAKWTKRSVQIGNNIATLDSRGLLHLHRASDKSEMTLMLRPEHVSGWTSWGERFGERECLGLESGGPSDFVLDWLEKFAKS